MKVFISDTERKVHHNTHSPKQSMLSLSVKYEQFVAILEVLTDRNKTKAYKLSLNPNSCPINNSYIFLLFSFI